jgi:hypothetical protein
MASTPPDAYLDAARELKQCLEGLRDAEIATLKSLQRMMLLHERYPHGALPVFSASVSTCLTRSAKERSDAIGKLMMLCGSEIREASYIAELYSSQAKAAYYKMISLHLGTVGIEGVTEQHRRDTLRRVKLLYAEAEETARIKQQTVDFQRAVQETCSEPDDDTT